MIIHCCSYLSASMTMLKMQVKLHDFKEAPLVCGCTAVARRKLSHLVYPSSHKLSDFFVSTTKCCQQSTDKHNTEE